MAWDWGGAGQGAASGAAAGTSIMPGWGTAIGGVAGGILGGFTGGAGKNPGNEGRKYLDQIPGTISPYYQQFIGQGRRAQQAVNPMYTQMMNDPGSIISRIGSGYQQSPGFQFQRDQGLQGITNAAAAGGMGGTPMHQQQAGQLANNMASADYNQYLQQALGIMGGGLQGKEGMIQRGYGASGDLAQSLMSQLMSQANLGYAGSANQNQAQQGMMGNMFGQIGGMDWGKMFGMGGGAGGAGGQPAVAHPGAGRAGMF